MSEALRSALTNAVLAYEHAAMGRRLSINGGAQIMEAEAKLIRDNLEHLARALEYQQALWDISDPQVDDSTWSNGDWACDRAKRALPRQLQRSGHDAKHLG